MTLQMESIITVLAVVGSALTIYFNLKKFGENIKSEAEWRTTVNNKIENLLEKVAVLLDKHDVTIGLVHDLIEFKTRQQVENEALHKEFATVWKRADEHREEIKEIRHHMSNCKACAEAMGRS